MLVIDVGNSGVDRSPEYNEDLKAVSTSRFIEGKGCCGFYAQHSKHPKHYTGIMRYNNSKDALISDMHLLAEAHMCPHGDPVIIFACERYFRYLICSGTSIYLH